jgi:hypothetical protein
MKEQLRHRNLDQLRGFIKPLIEVTDGTTILKEELNFLEKYKDVVGFLMFYIWAVF